MIRRGEERRGVEKASYKINSYNKSQPSVSMRTLLLIEGRRRKTTNAEAMH